MEEIEILKDFFKEKDPQELEKFAHFSWCATNIGKTSGMSIDMLDDLYCGLVSGVMGNLGSGKVPEKIEGIGPKPEDRYSRKVYETLWLTLIEFERSQNPIEKWREENPDKESWWEMISEGSNISDAYTENPEEWLVGYRQKMVELKNNIRG